MAACLQRTSHLRRPHQLHHWPQRPCRLLGARCLGRSHKACSCRASRTTCHHPCELHKLFWPASHFQIHSSFACSCGGACMIWLSLKSGSQAHSCTLLHFMTWVPAQAGKPGLQSSMQLGMTNSLHWRAGTQLTSSSQGPRHMHLLHCLACRRLFCGPHLGWSPLQVSRCGACFLRLAQV